VVAPDAIVVGGGVIGCAVAYHLVRAGAAVLVLERDRIAAHASSAAAGLVAPLAETLGEGVLCAVAQRSLAMLRGQVAELRELSGIDPGLHEVGVLRVASPDSAPELEKLASAVLQGCEWLSPADLYRLEPRLGPGFAGGLWFPDEGYLDARALTLAYARAAALAGVQFETGAAVLGWIADGGRVRGVHTSAGVREAPCVVLCCGAWTPQLPGSTLLPVEPVKGQMLELEAPPAPLPAVLWGPGAYLVPCGEAVRVGATVERVGYDVQVTGAGLAALLEGARGLLPQLGESGFRSAWAGLRPGTPDGLPLIGPFPGCEGLSVATGHFRYGVLLSEFTGWSVACGMLSGRWDSELSAFSPGRFTARGRE
jgi:glycine oxidase